MYQEKIELKRILFKETPAVRFSTYFDCSPNVWKEVWKRYKLLNYSSEEALQYLNTIIPNKIPLSDNGRRRFKRWIERTEIYVKAQVALNMKAKVVTLEYFAPHESFLIQELTKNKWQKKQKKPQV